MTLSVRSYDTDTPGNNNNNNTTSHMTITWLVTWYYTLFTIIIIFCSCYWAAAINASIWIRGGDSEETYCGIEHIPRNETEEAIDIVY